MTETDAKAQGGQKDGSVAADHELSAAASTVGEKPAKTLPGVSDDKQTSRP